MGSRGPQPKNPKTRARRNVDPNARALPADGRVDSIGRRLPVPLLEPSDRLWHPMTSGWWRALWRSPQATQFLETDRYALYRLAVLIDHSHRRASEGLSTDDLEGEIRLQEARFGITVADRARLHWTIEEVEPVASVAARAPSGLPAGADPRDLLEFPQAAG
jgi:hypothetical protein